MNKIRYGIIGSGTITRKFYMEWWFKDDPNVECVALCDTNKELVEKMAKTYNVGKTYTDYKELLKQDDIDAVCINTPNYLHREMALAAAEAKKHILVEKPMAMNIDEANDMIKAAKDNGVLLMVEQMQRFETAHEAAKKIIDEGKLGKIFTIRCKLGHSGPEFWNTDGVMRNWYFKKAMSGGGSMADVGIHAIDLIRWLTGKKITEVNAQIATLQKDIEVEDNGIGLLKFEDGTIGVVESSWTTGPWGVQSAIYGEKGTLHIVKGQKSYMQLHLCNQPPEDPSGTKEVIDVELAAESMHKSPVTYFANCIRENKKPFISGEEGRDSLEVIQACYKAVDEKKTVMLPLK
jgi:predicted dehydrogenase